MFRLIRHTNADTPDRYDVGLFMPEQEMSALTNAIRARSNIPDTTVEDVYSAQPHTMFDILNWAANDNRPYPGQDPTRLHWLSCIGVVEEPCLEASVNFHIGIIPEGFDTNIMPGEDASWSEVVAGMAETVVAYTLQRPEPQG